MHAKCFEDALAGVCGRVVGDGFPFLVVSQTGAFSPLVRHLNFVSF